jgi:hypothetical protein
MGAKLLLNCRAVLAEVVLLAAVEGIGWDDGWFTSV